MKRWIVAVAMAVAACGGETAGEKPLAGCQDVAGKTFCPRTDGTEGPDAFVCWWDGDPGECTRAETCYEAPRDPVNPHIYDLDGQWVVTWAGRCRDEQEDCVAFHADNPPCCYTKPGATWMGSPRGGWILDEVNENGNHPIVEAMDCD